MNYEKMSDFEINKLVERSKGFYTEDITGKYMPTFDYCNNPSDAWAIIVDNEIVVHPDKHTTSLAEVETLTHYISYEDKNPLRAAMIVFLMMNEDGGVV